MILQKLPRYYYDFRAKTIAPILRRVPYTLSDTLVVAVNAVDTAFNGNSFTNNVGMPFEIQTILPRVTFVDGSNNPVLPAAVGANVANPENFSKVTIRDTSANNDILNSQLIASLVDADTLVWVPSSPYYLAPTFGWVVKCSNTNTVNGIQFEFGLRGMLLELGDPKPAPADYVQE